MASVTLRGVRKSFGQIETIHGVDLDIPDGKFLVLVGPSGCGKSTLLRLLAGLEEVSGGSISIGERDVTDLTPAERGVAMVFQSYALYPHMTVAQNMGFGLEMKKLSKAEIQARVTQAAARLELTPLLDRLPKNLSGGQRQRVAIGRAIVRDPSVFLFDEPLSNLDAALRVQMRQEIAQLQRSLKVTTVYVTHDQVEAMTMADIICVLRGGAIEQVGTPLSLYHQPRNLFVAGFIGTPSMNILTARVTEMAGDRPTLRLPSEQSFSPAVRAPDARPGDSVSLGLRPEHLTLGAPDSAALTGTIRTVERLGEVHYAYLTLSDGQALTVKGDGDTALSPGDQVGVFLNAQECHLFNSQGLAWPRLP
jgi:ABC-type sugar transport system ATPase subunit